MTPQKVNDLTVAVKKTKINNGKKQTRNKRKVKKYDDDEVCFNNVSFKTWLA